MRIQSALWATALCLAPVSAVAQDFYEYWGDGRAEGDPGTPTPGKARNHFKLYGRPSSAQGSILGNREEPKMSQKLSGEYRSALWHPKKGQKTPPEGGPEMGPKK